MNKKTILILIILLLIVIIIPVLMIIKSINLNQNCTGYLKRAADANTVEIAYTELTKAIIYLEENNLTTGYTSILWKTPDDDIEFFYKNLKASQLELLSVNDSTSKFETSNILMKLRETLVDGGKYGDTLTVPIGLSRYPDNKLFFYIFLFGFIGLIITIKTIEIL